MKYLHFFTYRGINNFGMTIFKPNLILAYLPALYSMLRPFSARFNQKNSSMLCIGVNKIKIHFDTSQLCCGVVHLMTILIACGKKT